MKLIPLTKGKFAQVDDADFDELSKHKWYCLGGKYACRSVWPTGGGRRTVVLMHRQIMGPPAGIDVDHRDMDRLNNTRDNLRLATRDQNMCNQRGHADSTLGVKGVHREKRRGKFVAQISVRGTHHFLGHFVTIEEAAAAYAKAAHELHGEFARTS